MERISWDQYFMTQSHLLSLRSTCTRLAVGATIVRDKRIIAGGYNGSIAGGTHCADEGCYVIDNHCVRTIHAEVNALLQCAKFGIKTEGAEMYVTHFPCLNCCKAIIQSGITAVYYAKDYKNHPYAVELFKQANVKMKHVPLQYSVASIEQNEKAAQINQLLDEVNIETAEEEVIRALLGEVKRLIQPS